MSSARAVILGSAFEQLDELSLSRRAISTPFGEAILHHAGDGRWVLFRHGSPHTYLPNQIPYRAHAWALHHVGVRKLLITSSVGVLQPGLPLFTPMVVTDLIWPDQRMPDGTPATMFPTPSPQQGHLVLEVGLFHPALRRSLVNQICDLGFPKSPPELLFWYAPGPRTKTSAENRWLVAQGLHVNSMTLAPEAVLAAELEIATAAVVVGHKASGVEAPALGREAVRASLEQSRAGTLALAMAFLEDTTELEPINHIYRYDDAHGS